MKNFKTIVEVNKFFIKKKLDEKIVELTKIQSKD